MSLAERYAAVIAGRPATVVIVLLLATAAVGSAAGSVDSGLTIAGFSSDSTAQQKLDYVEANFSTPGEDTTAMQVVVRGDDVLSKESLLASLRLQKAIREDPEINGTLRDSGSTVGLANLVAIAAASGGGPPGSDGASGGDGAAGDGSGSDGAPGADGSGSDGAPGADGSGSDGAPDGSGADGPPTGDGAVTMTLDEQIRTVESLSEAELEAVLDRLLAPDRPAGGPDPYRFLPTDYERGASADARVLFVFQSAPGGNELPEDVVAAQVATADLVEDRYGAEGAFVFGRGIVTEESTQATGDSFALISPVALLLVLGVLLVAYRDPLDVLLGLFGVVLVLVWMGGIMGWLGIGVTQIIIAVPFLLIGLSIDFALHVVMRYREARAEEDRSVTEGMRVGLAGVAVAIAAATFTTAVGFLSNAVSPIRSIQEFGIVSGLGIVAAFVVFAGLIPALKVLLDRLAERVGLARDRRAFGTGGGRVTRLLTVGAALARRAPAVVLVVALVVSAGGAYAATDIDTSISQEDFLPRDSPAWMDAAPEPFRPGDYDLKENAVFLNDRFLQDRASSRVEFLVEGDVTDDDTLERVAGARDRIAETDSAITLANGRPSVEGPLTLVESVAARNETVAAVVREADTDGDGVPDRNLEAVYDAVYAAAPEEAAAVIYRDGTGADAEYRALRLSVAIRGDADTAGTTAEMRDVAGATETDSGLTVTATGAPVVDSVVQAALLRTLVETFLITLGVILAFLTAIFYRRYGTLTLGAVTLVPVVFALSWILGTMYLLEIPFNTETAVIASIAIGLGVDYAIHVSERFVEERGRADSTTAALEATLSGTGGALMASAATTASGFGVLLLALVPSLRRFGLVTGVTIVYAFVASVVVLPSLLELWARYGSDASGLDAEADVDSGEDHEAAPDQDPGTTPDPDPEG